MPCQGSEDLVGAIAKENKRVKWQNGRCSCLFVLNGRTLGRRLGSRGSGVAATSVSRISSYLRVSLVFFFFFFFFGFARRRESRSRLTRGVSTRLQKAGQARSGLHATHSKLTPVSGAASFSRGGRCRSYMV